MRVRRVGQPRRRALRLVERGQVERDKEGRLVPGRSGALAWTSGLFWLLGPKEGKGSLMRL